MKNNKIAEEFNAALFQGQEYHDYSEITYLGYVACTLAPLLHTEGILEPTMLDIGCGNGLLTRLLQILCNIERTYGMDVNLQTILNAQKIYPSINFVHGSQENLPFQSNTFDRIYAHEVLHHIPSQHQRECFSEIVRVLKPGGVAIVIEFNPYNPWTRYVFKYNPEEQGLTMLTPNYIKKLMQPYGSVKTYYFGFFQSWFLQLRFLEKYLYKLPLGSLYAVILHKNK